VGTFFETQCSTTSVVCSVLTQLSCLIEMFTHPDLLILCAAFPPPQLASSILDVQYGSNVTPVQKTDCLFIGQARYCNGRIRQIAFGLLHHTCCYSQKVKAHALQTYIGL